MRSEPAIFLQEALTIFAVNFFCRVKVWIDQNALKDAQTLPFAAIGIKKQVQVAANALATVIQNPEGMLYGSVQPALLLANRPIRQIAIYPHKYWQLVECQ